MNNIFLDTETCGFHGPIVLMQYAIEDGDIHLYSPWTEEIGHTLDLIEEFCNNCIIGFNLAFDWFHICQFYTTLSLLGEQVGLDKCPIDFINEYALLESKARDGLCLKPANAFDVMLHARKTKYQSTMNRRPIVIKKVPIELADLLRQELENRVKLKDIYFARKKDSSDRWQLEETKDPGFCNIILRFKASSALKALAVDALGLIENPLLRGEVFPSGKPVEAGYAPFALALASTGEAGIDWKGTWPDIITVHISHWTYNPLARKYAENDVVYTRDLYKYFESPTVGDDDSILACMVGAVRWRGFKIDIPGIKKLRKQALVKSNAAPKAPNQVRKYISEKMPDVLKAVIAESTKRTVLEEIAAWKKPVDIAKKAQACLDARRAAKEIEIYDKLLLAGRFHASFKVIGTRSTRMSGADKLNPQGIKHDKYVREMFPLALAPLVLTGGDFSAFEVSIAAAVYGDEELNKQLCTCSKCEHVCSVEEFATTNTCVCCGAEDSKRKLHGLLAQEFFPGMNYEEIIATKGTDDDKYDKGKRGVFGVLYGGDWNTWVRRLGIDEDSAIKAFENWGKRYKGVGKFRDGIKEKYCSMRQPGGIGTRVEWHEPADYIETLMGFRRYFTLENDICRTLFNLANKLPESWKDIKIKCQRRDRIQTVGGAVMSALYAAAFNIQAQSMRAAANHLIQSAGATITKKLQCKLWELQPIGVTNWQIQPMNIHDEIMAPALPTLGGQITQVVCDFVEEMRPYIPLIKIDWSNNLTTWADK